jgi:hypothetical protein
MRDEVSSIICDNACRIEIGVHLLVIFPNFSFVQAWKAASIALIGLFGILGLLTNFKDKQTGKITNWGWVSLAGIVLSSVCGVTAQLKESSDNATKALAIAQSSNATLTNIQRSLSSLNGAQYSLVFDVACADRRYANFCKLVSHGDEDLNNFEIGSESYKSLERKQWSLFPGGRLRMRLALDFFIDPKKADVFVKSYDYSGAQDLKGNLSMRLLVSNYGAGDFRFKNILGAYPSMGDTVLIVPGTQPDHQVRNDGKIASLLDLKGVTVVITEDSGILDDLSLAQLTITLNDGQSRKVFWDSLQRVSISGKSGFRFVYKDE